jgi:hypothetical protein
MSAVLKISDKVWLEVASDEVALVSRYRIAWYNIILLLYASFAVGSMAMTGFSTAIRATFVSGSQRVNFSRVSSF